MHAHFKWYLCKTVPIQPSHKTLSINVNPVVQPALSIQHKVGNFVFRFCWFIFGNRDFRCGKFAGVSEWLVMALLYPDQFCTGNAGTLPGGLCATFKMKPVRPDSAVSSTVNITAEQTPPSPQISTSAGVWRFISSVNDAGLHLALDGQIISTGSQAGIQCTGSGIYLLAAFNTFPAQGDTSNVLTVICTGNRKIFLYPCWASKSCFW